MKDRTRRSNLHWEVSELLASLGMTLRGWANYFRSGVSKAIFSSIDAHAWRRITRWIHLKHSRMNWQQLRRLFCLPGTWKLASGGVVFKGAASVPVVRYRYRGSKIPTPWTPTETATAA